MPTSRFSPLQAFCLVLILLGLATTIYLTIAHYTTGVSLACPGTGIINCAKVTSSTYSAIAGIPLAVIGLVFFVILLPLHLGLWWQTARWARAIRLLLLGGGVLTALGLVYIELFQVNAICLYCTVVHVLIFGLFCANAFRVSET